MNTAAGGASPSKYLVALTVMIGTLMEVIDTSVANVSLPHMQGSFSAGQDEITWVITSYLVANAVILPLSGWIGNYFGRKRAYLTCLGIFTLASVGSGAAVSLPMIVGMRVLQGLAGGAMVPMSQAILLETFPKEEHGKAMALFGVGVIFGPIVGPTLGGWITDTVGWRWVFYINAPLGLLGALLGGLVITDPPYLKRPEGRVDLLSFLFIASGLGCLEILLNRGERYDWLESVNIQLLALGAALGIALFIWRSFTAERPLVNLRLFRNREFTAGTMLMFLLGFGLYGSFTMLPLFLQHMLGYTATLAGLVLSPGGLMSLLSMVFVGALIGRVDTRFLVAFGALMNVWSMALLQHVNLEVDFWYVTVPRLMQGFGMGFLFVPLTTAAFARLRPEQMGQATGLFNLLRNEGGSVGIAISSTVLARHTQIHYSQLGAHLTAGDPLLRERVAETAQRLAVTSGLDPSTNAVLAQAITGREVARQAMTLAYRDVFWLLTLAFLAFLPFILLLRSGKRKNGKGGGGMAVH
ncbi:MAG TPA: DHA2 family efflux MFS transporter permease subunit [Candidatus Krumholzibacteria bacterium]|nr:DHA2 family efflux MFS transporter permease subunit [Candidatus Krumholzibacteria bacterium]HRX51467.1 DHA2 family efflux MFS transporter permease subunit [Candidatus Krumholzibacteria bacterium]